MGLSCAYRCFEIGGPWISANPDCPVHGAASEPYTEPPRASVYGTLATGSDDDRLFSELKEAISELAHPEDQYEDSPSLTTREKLCSVALAALQLVRARAYQVRDGNPTDKARIASALDALDRACKNTDR